VESGVEIGIHRKVPRRENEAARKMELEWRNPPRSMFEEFAGVARGSRMEFGVIHMRHPGEHPSGRATDAGVK
jgi:hypothetical protein